MHNLQHLANLRFRDISDQAREAAKQQTVALLKKIDIKTCDEIRRSFELPPEALGFITEIYAAVLAAPNGERRMIMPISSAVHYTAEDATTKPTTEPRVRAMQKVTLKLPILGGPFLPSRFVVSNAGSIGGAADWLIEDLRGDGKSQFKQPGPVPGDLFATNAVDTVVEYHACKESIEVDVMYIGLNDCTFFSAMIGSAI
jgi:hypothetical protein